MSMKAGFIDISTVSVDAIDRFSEYVEKQAVYRQVWSICRLNGQKSDPGPNCGYRLETGINL
jgi:hypothetical protein